MKYKGHHHKDVVWMNPAHLDHLLEMVNKLEQKRDHELGMKKTQQKNKNPPISGRNVNENMNL